MKRKSKLTAMLIAIFSLLSIACSSNGQPSPVADISNDKKQIVAMLDSFNTAAAKADYKTYFNFYADNAIFTGTDATERWDKKEFMVWAKPYFDKGQAWNFKTLNRNIYFDKTGNIAWFDKLLNTQMKICRGSGVLVKQGSQWKIAQYILSATVPNDQMDNVIKMKSHMEDSIISKLAPETKEAEKENVRLNIDPVKISPGIFSILMENEHVRVVQYSLKPGEKDEWHTHPAKSSYVVSGGKLKVHLENGDIILTDEKTGTVSWMDYVGKHYVENIGNTTVTIVFTEIK